jgi:hypothetical protein
MSASMAGYSGWPRSNLHLFFATMFSCRRSCRYGDGKPITLRFTEDGWEAPPIEAPVSLPRPDNRARAAG